MIKKYYFFLELNNGSNGKNGLKFKNRLKYTRSKNQKKIRLIIKSLK